MVSASVPALTSSDDGLGVTQGSLEEKKQWDEYLHSRFYKINWVKTVKQTNSWITPTSLRTLELLILEAACLRSWSPTLTCLPHQFQSVAEKLDGSWRATGPESKMETWQCWFWNQWRNQQQLSKLTQRQEGRPSKPEPGEPPYLFGLLWQSAWN